MLQNPELVISAGLMGHLAREFWTSHWPKAVFNLENVAHSFPSTINNSLHKLTQAWKRSGPMFFNFCLMREWYDDMIDHRSCTHNLSSCHGFSCHWFESRSRLNFFSGFNLTTAQVLCITAMINQVFISFSAVRIYDLPHIHLYQKNSWINSETYVSIEARWISRCRINAHCKENNIIR